MGIETTIEDIVDMAGEILDHSDMGTSIDKEYQDKLKVIHSLIKEVHEHCCGEEESEEEDDDDDKDDMKEEISSISTGKLNGLLRSGSHEISSGEVKSGFNVTVRHRRTGKLKTFFIENSYDDALVNKTVAYVTRMKSVTEKKDDPCWDSHEMIGMKTKNGKKVPNCVPKAK